MSAREHRADARKATPGHWRRLSCRGRMGCGAVERTSDQLRKQADFKALMEDEVQDDQHDQRDAKQPAEKVRHDVISFRNEV